MLLITNPDIDEIRQYLQSNTEADTFSTLARDRLLPQNPSAHLSPLQPLQPPPARVAPQAQ